jgi:hypothetical protein
MEARENAAQYKADSMAKQILVEEASMSISMNTNTNMSMNTTHVHETCATCTGARVGQGLVRDRYALLKLVVYFVRARPHAPARRRRRERGTCAQASAHARTSKRTRTHARAHARTHAREGMCTSAHEAHARTHTWSWT